jgi:glyoxalase family protein
VNFDDPGSHHLYFGDEVGRPSTASTFFEWPQAPKGYPGIGGGAHHLALQVADYDGLLKWKRLIELGLKVDGPYDRHYFTLAFPFN